MVPNKKKNRTKKYRVEILEMLSEKRQEISKYYFFESVSFKYSKSIRDDVSASLL